MNLSLHIARRLHFTREGKKNISRPAVRIATVGIAVGLAVMIAAVSVVIGFKQEIRNKVIGFGSHIQISNFDNNITYETQPIVVGDSLINTIKAIPDVVSATLFCTKPGIIKTAGDFQGIVVKGVDNCYDWSFFKINMLEGDVLNLNDTLPRNEVIISRYLANLLQLKLDDSFFVYFVQDNVRVRKMKITGIYSTNFMEYDKLFLIADMRHIQQINRWEADEVSGIEIFIKDFEKTKTAVSINHDFKMVIEKISNLDFVADEVYFKTANKPDRNGSFYNTRTIKELNPQIFSWLDLLDTNVWVILILMILVAGFNMISGLLILILEQINTIGLLKAMGMTNWSIRKVFLYQSVFLIGKGMLWGNIIGISLIAIQYSTGIIPLNPDIYYVSTIPVSVNLLYLLLLNIGSLICSLLMLIAPSYIITKIFPAKAIKFE